MKRSVQVGGVGGHTVSVSDRRTAGRVKGKVYKMIVRTCVNS